MSNVGLDENDTGADEPVPMADAAQATKASPVCMALPFMASDSCICDLAKLSAAKPVGSEALDGAYPQHRLGGDAKAKKGGKGACICET